LTAPFSRLVVGFEAVQLLNALMASDLPRGGDAPAARPDARKRFGNFPATGLGAGLGPGRLN
jgi:hypothetical protein